MFERISYRLQRWAVRWNRPLCPRGSFDVVIDGWGARSLLTRLAGARFRLLVTITTHRRPQELISLISALSKALGDVSMPVFVCVLNDASDADYSGARALLQERFGGNSHWLDASENFGKQRFWMTHQLIFLAAKEADAEYLLSLQDDIDLVPNFLQKLWKVWEATGELDARRRVLYLFSTDDDESGGRWHSFQRVSFPRAQARRTDWFDLQAFLIDRSGLSLLRYWVVPISALRWRRDPTISSGVGQQLTIRMAGRATVYQCDPPLVIHGKAHSQMNPEARTLRPLDNRASVRTDEL